MSSGWKDDARTGPWRTRTGTPSSVASTSTSSPDRDHQRRPDEDGRQRRPLAGAEAHLALEGLPLAAVAVAAHDRIEHAEGALVGTPVEHLPRHQDEAGAGPEDRQASVAPAGDSRSAIASNSPVDSSSMDSVVDSPPGRIRPSSPSRSAGRLTRRAELPDVGQRGDMLAHVALQVEHADQRTRPRPAAQAPSPLPPPVGEMLAVLRRLQPAHRLAEPA